MSRGRLRTGPSHAHGYRVNREVLGGKRYDTVANDEDTYPLVGVPKGQLSGELFHEGGRSGDGGKRVAARYRTRSKGMR